MPDIAILPIDSLHRRADARPLNDNVLAALSESIEQVGLVKPMPIDLLDILTLRSMEAVGEEKFDRDARIARKTIKAKAKRDPRLKKIVGKMDLAQHFTLPIEDGVLAA